MSIDSRILLLDAQDGRLLHELAGHSGPVIAIACTATHALSLATDGRLGVWDIASGQKRYNLSADAFGIRALLGVTPDGRRALSQSRGGIIEVWDLMAGKRLHALPHRARILDCALSADSARALTAARDGRLILWHLDSGRAIAEFTADGQMRVCGLLPDGERAIAGDSLGRVHLLRATTAVTSGTGE